MSAMKNVRSEIKIRTWIVKFKYYDGTLSLVFSDAVFETFERVHKVMNA